VSNIQGDPGGKVYIVGGSYEFFFSQLPILLPPKILTFPPESPCVKFNSHFTENTVSNLKDELFDDDYGNNQSLSRDPSATGRYIVWINCRVYEP